ncbi:MAG TPA: class I SAM-dependent methyltransferase [Desulfatiglandales bacterium]|nr:class I SAM-dependent methyltransferase [Desulfatiglandales bacterium]
MEEKGFNIQFPENSDHLEQDEEYFLLEYKGERKNLRCHDYSEIYSVPGLYEHLFYEKLKCNSPETVCAMLEHEVKQSSDDVSELTVLDVGAGNGMVGEKLSEIGVETVVGLDIIEEAAKATARDRQGVYDAYYVADLTDLPDPIREELLEKDFNCLTTVATLGFGDIPPAAFSEAYNLISTPGWIAFNIKDEFLNEANSTGFSGMVKQMIASDVLKLRSQKRYCHRLSLSGDPLYYLAIVGEKSEDISMDLLK